MTELSCISELNMGSIFIVHMDAARRLELFYHQTMHKNVRE